jgi:hypothetical protein
MCKFYSAIVMRNGDLLHNENLMSHEDIIRLFNINDSQVNCDKFVRVEFTPDEYSDYPDIEKYKLNVDEEIIPEWFEKHREYITSRLKEFVSKRIITSDQKILTGGLYVVKDCIIDKLIIATVVFLQGTVQEVCNGGTVQKVCNGGTVQEVWDGGTVQKVLDGGTVQKVLDGGTVQKVCNGGTVQEVWDGGTVQKVLDGGTVNGIKK